MNALTLQLYPVLLHHAACLLAGASSGSVAMQPGDLLHAAVERICRQPPETILNEPAAFIGLVRTVMQRILINEYRRNSAARRPPATMSARLEEAGEISAPESTCEAAEDIHHALAALAVENPDAARVVRGLLFLEGKSTRELAVEFNVSIATISRRWTLAATWLRRKLEAA